ncbi:MAG: hypothetical protein H0Z24_06810 [Thermosipho sp. (in: Bacteria)]|nr:hypothetical protein [Thermosipho sp. (in: thermotogales)]
MAKASVRKATFRIPCDIFWCNNPADYVIGNVEGPPSAELHICKSCLEGIAKTMPKELLPKVEVVKEVVKEEKPKKTTKKKKGGK